MSSHRSPSSAFPRTTVCQDSLAMNDHAEVCPLSRRVMSQPVSRPLQTGIRFLRTPLPATPTAFLAVRLPLPAACRAYPVSHESPDGADPSCAPAALMSMTAYPDRAVPCRLPFGSSQSAGLARPSLRHVGGRSHVLVVPIRPLLRSAFLLAESALPRGSAYRVTRRLRCPRSFTPSRCQLRMSG